MPKPAAITSPVQLVVEGNDQVNFFRAFVKHVSLANVQIQNFGGISELRAFLAALAVEPDFEDWVERLGIVRDAETHAEGAFESVRSSLANAGLPAPDGPEVLTGDRPPAVSVLILPGEGREGMLETLLCESFAGKRIDRCIDEFFECRRRLGTHEVGKGARVCVSDDADDDTEATAFRWGRGAARAVELGSLGVRRRAAISRGTGQRDTQLAIQNAKTDRPMHLEPDFSG